MILSFIFGGRAYKNFKKADYTIPSEIEWMVWVMIGEGAFVTNMPAGSHG